MHLSKEEQIIYNHFNDLFNLAYQRGIPVFSDFAGLNETGLMYRLLDDKHIPADLIKERVITYGGYEHAERQIICFLPEQTYNKVTTDDFPIECVRISPVNKKFCDALTHRDYLGTVMNIGLERNQIGDIIVKKEGSENNISYTGYVFCRKNKSELLTDITRIKHTTVHVEIVDGAELLLKQEYKEISGSVSSLRIDSVIAVALKSSRSRCLTLIREGNVFVNGRCCTENAKNVCNGDIISIRGHGKYMIEEPQSITKKGRYHITVKQYI